jgi:hypothetical protein
MRDDFCAFILTHGRPDRVHTYKTLMKSGYTGKVYIVIDNEDKTADEYRKIYGDKVLMFDKEKAAQTTDDGDNFGIRGVVYARNACHEIAKTLSVKYFLVLDDDYTDFSFRFNGKNKWCRVPIAKKMDDVFLAMIDYLQSTPAASIAFAQTGEMIGGFGGGEIKGGLNAPRMRRKAMNSFFCATERPFKFFGHINEDVNCYVNLGRRGDLFFTVLQVALTQKATQANSGGLTEFYLDVGTYIKSFYSVMYAPSCVKIGTLGDFRSPHFRIHHKINWHNTAPKILREEWKKESTNG